MAHRKRNTPGRRALLRACGGILLAAVGLRLLLTGIGTQHLGGALDWIASGLLASSEVTSAGAYEDLVPAGGVLPPLSDPTETPAPTATQAPSGDSHQVIPITISPSSSDGYVTASGVYLKNQTSMTIDLNRALSTEPDLSLQAGQPQVLIVHTHGTESYLLEDQETYQDSDIIRTEDPEKNVLRVGQEIQSVLESRGLVVLHDTEIYDSPSYAGSYTRALAGIQAYLEQYPSIQVVIDVHRDALSAEDQSMYKTVTDIQGVRTAQVMLVMGTDQGGLSHPGWKSNLRLAVRLQQQMEEKYPSLARPISLRESRFNQHLTPGSMLVEVGTAVNTLEEAVNAGRLFADCAADVLLQYVNE